MGNLNDDQNAEIQRLKDELDRTKQELEEAKHAIKVKDIELKAILVQADEVSHTDSLTYLPNRRQVINSLQKEVHRAERYKTSLSISMLDIDHFKRINDSYGHTVGDQVLYQLANLLREGVRESDMVGRYGGEEFLILLPNTKLPKAAELAARLCKIIRETEISVGEKTALTVSIGVAEYKHCEETWQKFLSRADMALYDAKNAGRDRWAISKG
jgi:diguanylate cyclase (GGDEF)-like protein